MQFGPGSLIPGFFISEGKIMTITKYTPEQADIMDEMPELDGIMLVSAGAGTGKSFMAEMITRALSPKRGLYTAFNKAIVQEGVTRFKGTNMECKTMHALAHRYVKPDKIDDLTYTCIEENITYHKKAKVIKAIDMFFVSKSVDMYEFFEEYFEEEKDNERMCELCTKYIEMMIERKIPHTFNFMLKYFHLMLVEGSIDCSYDLVILDEINDTTAVVLEIFKLIDAPKKLGLGEPHQAIYQFLNLVNGFDELEDVPLKHLTHSWRCSERIAERIQTFYNDEADKEFRFVGTDSPVQNGKRLYCTMTNASIISEISECLAQGKGFTLLRTPSDIFACPLALMSANSGKEPYQKKYKFLLNEYHYYQDQPAGSKTFFNYLLEHVDDTEIKNGVRLLMNFNRKGINLFDVYKRTKNARADKNYTIATVFTSKGLEFETVDIAEDMNANIQRIRDDGGIRTEEDLVAYRCYYVACSRAGMNLHNATKLPK